MAWEDWEDEQTAAIWHTVLEVLDEEAQRFRLDRKNEAGITVTRARWDAPDIELRWGQGGVERNIQATVKSSRWPLTIEFSGAVWQDRQRPEGRERRWNSMPAFSHSYADAADLRSQVQEQLTRAYAAVSELSVAGGSVAAIPPVTSAPRGRATSAD